MNPYRDLDRNHEAEQLLASVNTMLGRVGVLLGPRPRDGFWRRFGNGWRAFVRELKR